MKTEEQIKKEIETKLIELTYKRTNGKYLYDLSLTDFFLVAEKKKYKQQFVERVIYHVHGLNQLHEFWNKKNYKDGYRSRRLDIFRSETPTKNFKIVH